MNATQLYSVADNYVVYEEDVIGLTDGYSND